MSRRKLLELNTDNNRRLYDLVAYFNKTVEEKEKELPQFFHDNYPHVYDQWTEQNLDYFKDPDYNEDEDDGDFEFRVPEFYHHLEDKYLKEYTQFLVEIIDNFRQGDNPYDLSLDVLPLYYTFTYEGTVEDDWLIHFTEHEDTQEQIIESGYFLGIPSLYNLAISAANEEDWVKDGYCFAYEYSDSYYNYKNGTIKYGNYGVLFKGSGVKLYHGGDEEHQVVFIGDQVSNMIPFDTDGKSFKTKDGSIKENDIEDFMAKLGINI